MRYTTSAIFWIFDIKRISLVVFCVPYVYVILHIFGHATDAFVLRSFWHYRRCHTTNRAVSTTAYFLVHYAPKKWFSWAWWFPSRNILAPMQRISKETFSNHIAALAGAFGVRKNEKVCAFQYFQNFNFKKLENPEPFVRSEAQAFKKTHKWNNCRLECSVSLLFFI